MSKTYSLVCDDCKVEYWCGQGDRLYCKDTVTEFLHSHRSHKLRFIDNVEDAPIEDYKEVYEDKHSGDL